MGVAADKNAIEAAVADGLTDAPVAWPNRAFTPPAKTNDPAAPASWYSVDTEYGTGEGGDSTEELSFERDEMRHGEVVIGCWVEPQAGEARADAMTDLARAVFTNASTTLMSFFAPHIENAGFGKDSFGGLWYGVWVRWPFMAQD